ncbi:hypothetical protein ASC75_23670 [Aminobacter sp. DSM 101952]|uniref:hypothetical protein n=1 Tax=Aminobacter sp. DSM 101952 TaxID=2735891 RepID=UPI0006F4B748|nr:hypothetical protein [Aminobacter sp. DSM 101952]KQU72390.1 hypothetical protein ASC75_23670 [Aminobacter sp. DSM 101952]
MSCDSHRQYFVSSDMAMIERVLAHSDLRLSPGDVALSCGATKFLIRKFQEGMIEEDALSMALDRYLRIVRAWWSRPHCTDVPSYTQDWHRSERVVKPTGERHMGAESPVLVISDLRRAAEELRKLSDFERAKLLQRAAACIDECHNRLDWPNSQAIDPDGCDIAFDLAAMASAIDLFDAAEIATVIRRAVAIIGTLMDEMYPASIEVNAVSPATSGWFWRAGRAWMRRVIRPQRSFDQGETEARS